MRFIRIKAETTPTWGIAVDDYIYPLDAELMDDTPYENISNPSYRRRIEKTIKSGAIQGISPDGVSPLTPVPSPGKIICVGLNYHDHAEEQDKELPEKPMLFGKSSSAVTNPENPIIYPPDVQQLDYEVELCVIIGRLTKDVSRTEAESYIAGYSILNDVSARDAQFEDGQFYRGKSYDTFAPIGPELVTTDEVDPNSLEVELHLNGDKMQHSTTDEFIFSVHELIEYISSVTTLLPGDVISTGTPGGVGIFREPPKLLEPGDIVEASIEGLGSLTNTIVAPDT